MPNLPLDPLAIFRALADNHVNYILVGGMSAVLHGALIATEDIDVVHDRSPENIERLLGTLGKLHARFRSHPDLQPTASHLAGPGHVLLETDAGPLDVLGSIGAYRDYVSLLPHVVRYTLDDLTIQVLDLPTLIASKEEANREKDRAVLPLLRTTLQRIKERQQGIQE